MERPTVRMLAQDFIGSTSGGTIGSHERAYLTASLAEFDSFGQEGLRYAIYSPRVLIDDFLDNHERAISATQMSDTKLFKSPFMLRSGPEGAPVAVCHDVDRLNMVPYRSAKHAAEISLAHARAVRSRVYFAGYRDLTCVKSRGRREELPERDFKFALQQEISMPEFCSMLNENAEATGADLRIVRIDSCWQWILAKFCRKHLRGFVILAMGKGRAYRLDAAKLGWLVAELPLGTVGSRVFLRLRASGALRGKFLREFAEASKAANVRVYTNGQGSPKNGQFQVEICDDAAAAEMTFDEAFGEVRPPFDECTTLGLDEPDVIPPVLESESDGEGGCLIMDEVIGSVAEGPALPAPPAGVAASARALHKDALSGLL
jgi:hypothetical protein